MTWEDEVAINRQAPEGFDVPAGNHGAAVVARLAAPKLLRELPR